MTQGFAIDLGGTKTAAAVVTNGQVVARLQAPTDGQAGLAQQLETLAGLLSQLGFRRGDRLGTAVAGRISADGNWQAVNAATLSGIGAEPLLAQLQDRFGPDVSVRNDAAAAALAEARKGAGAGSAHFAYLTVSTGVGGGIVLNGRLLQSANGLAGHLGFMSSPLGTARCGSGRWGTVESVASGRAIALAAGTPDARAAFADTSDRARAAIDRSAAAVARQIADLTALFGLDRVAIGGGVGLAPGYLLRVQSHLTSEPELFRVPVNPASLGQDSALIGALMTEEDIS
ncbi:ROK family protein [Paracoccus stylophorae]|uniref:ROK family protein n=1 Tax=Paracoccus stylophorae TaxID=659350 RepID=A0ABY7SYB5_9RHOB|nr:ROK family protein [Paracoccus stylophorae]WCR11367.1 ROK family protein [Paracoccus stylophorae]